MSVGPSDGFQWGCSPKIHLDGRAMPLRTLWTAPAGCNTSWRAVDGTNFRDYTAVPRVGLHPRNCVLDVFRMDLQSRTHYPRVASRVHAYMMTDRVTNYNVRECTARDDDEMLDVTSPHHVTPCSHSLRSHGDLTKFEGILQVRWKVPSGMQRPGGSILMISRGLAVTPGNPESTPPDPPPDPP
jgi:hypothetical protein